MDDFIILEDYESIWHFLSFLYGSFGQRQVKENTYD